MLTVAAGTPLIELVTLCRAARQPLLLHGKHGTGKSDLFAEAARQLGIGFIVRDLSLLEPVDLIGIPRVESDGRTHYAPPSFLPDAGDGLFVIEELNRAPRYMQAPCLQLLTARRLNDFKLPAGWLPCAAINDGADGYLVEELDEALLSRFLRVKVVPDVKEWLTWAQQHGIHERIRAFVQNSPGIFDDPASNPRAWTYASRLLAEWERGERQQSILAAALGGVLSEKWALAFIRHYHDERRPLQPDEIIESYPVHQACLRDWIGSGHLDAVAASVELLKRHMQSQRVYDGVLGVAALRTNVETFIRDLPGDLRRQLRDWSEERGFKELAKVARPRRPRP